MRKPLLLFVILGYISAISAQTTTQGGINGDGVAISDLKPNLIPSSKLFLDPDIPKNMGSSLGITYNPLNFQWNTRKIAKIDPPVGHFEPGLDTSYNPNYVRLGYGNYSHKLLEGYLANRANNKWAYNMAVMHLSADQKDSIRDFSTTKGYLTGARFFKRSSLEMRLNYHRDMNRFFAKDTVYKEDKAQKKKIGQDLGFQAMYDLKANDAKPGFKTGFMFHNYFNNLLQSETELGLLGGWDFVFPKFKTFGDFAASNIKFRQSYTTTNQWFIDFLPRVQYHDKKNGLEVIIGANLSWVFKDTSKPVFYFNPYLYGEKKLEGLKIKVYGGIDGGLKKNSIRRFSEKVPFTFDTIKVFNTYEQLRMYAGLKGRITENSQFNVELGGNSISDMPLVVTSADSINALQLVYDDVNNVYFMADLRFSIGENLRVSAGGKINNYTTKTEARAWHLPAQQFSLNASYNLQHKWIFALGIDGMGKRSNRQIGGSNNLQMKGFADLNVRVDYVLKDMVRLWVQGSNLLNQRYQLWYGYGSYRLNVIGGISASF
ncbi:MAG: TonB-dependent receptor [Bacteroidetes bacterium]|nr:TonB-dependent receptor [Bacteroidota bacterium]